MQEAPETPETTPDQGIRWLIGRLAWERRLTELRDDASDEAA